MHGEVVDAEELREGRGQRQRLVDDDRVGRRAVRRPGQAPRGDVDLDASVRAGQGVLAAGPVLLRQRGGGGDVGERLRPHERRGVARGLELALHQVGVPDVDREGGHPEHDHDDPDEQEGHHLPALVGLQGGVSAKPHVLS